MKCLRMTTTAFTTSSKLRLALWLVLVPALLNLIGCATANKMISSRRGFNRSQHMIGFYEVESVDVGDVFEGEASFYGPGFHGKKTANGETYNQNDFTCASKTLPFNTKLKVTLLTNGKSVNVRVTDRGPYKDDRIIDLSVAAAHSLGMTGIGRISAEVIP